MRLFPGRLGRRRQRPFNPDRQPEPLRRSRWVSPSLLVQAVPEQLSALLALMPPPASAPPPRITHFVNLYPPPEGDMTQAHTIASMRRAAAAHDGPVRLLCIQHRDDPDQTPEGFARGPDLSRNVLDIAPLVPPRPLPLLFDILESGAADAADDGFLVFTNADICLQPHFYTAVSALLARGFEALVINRRTVGAALAEDPAAPLLAAETGDVHPGFDCFVFRARLARNFLRNDACIGMRAVSLGLLYNLIAHAPRMAILTNATLTYHFGDDARWDDSRFAAYTRHNQAAALQTARALLLAGSREAERLMAYCRHCYAPPYVRTLLHELFGAQARL